MRLGKASFLSPPFDARKRDWQRRVDSLLVDAFDREKADEVMAGGSVVAQLEKLWALSREMDELPLNPKYRGS